MVNPNWLDILYQYCHVAYDEKMICESKIEPHNWKKMLGLK